MTIALVSIACFGIALELIMGIASLTKPAAKAS